MQLYSFVIQVVPRFSCLFLTSQTPFYLISNIIFNHQTRLIVYRVYHFEFVYFVSIQLFDLLVKIFFCEKWKIELFSKSNVRVTSLVSYHRNKLEFTANYGLVHTKLRPFDFQYIKWLYQWSENIVVFGDITLWRNKQIWKIRTEKLDFSSPGWGFMTHG